MKKTQNAHYIDNKQFFAAMKEWKLLWDDSVKNNLPRPKCTNYLGECFVKISNHLAYKSNFVNYTYRDEMILDGIENCLRYADRFNPEKSNNPFAYFTQITYYSFIRRIKKEAKQSDTKLRYLQNIDLHQLLDEIDNDSSNHEYFNWVQEQLDKSLQDKADMKKMSNSSYTRRPKYFDEDANIEEGAIEIEDLEDIDSDEFFDPNELNDLKKSKDELDFIN